MHHADLKDDYIFDDLTRHDYHTFRRIFVNFHPSEAREAMMKQSVLGHAQNGHCGYGGIKFPQAQITNILDVTDSTKVESVRRAVSREIDRTKYYLEGLVMHFYGSVKIRNFSGKQIYVESLDAGKPFFGLKEFDRERYHLPNCMEDVYKKNHHSEEKLSRKEKKKLGSRPKQVKKPFKFSISDDPGKLLLKGACLASFMDSAEYRTYTHDLFEGKGLDGLEFKLGRGICMVGDLKEIKKHHTDIYGIANREISKDEIASLEKKGVLVPIHNYRPYFSSDYHPDHINTYVRQKVGPGTCDDAALIWIGINYGIHAFMGAMLVDVVDTFDKVAAFPITGGADEHIGHRLNSMVEERTGKPLVTKDEVAKLIYFAAKDNTYKIPFSNSVRRFNQYQKCSKKDHKTAIQAHLDYIKKGKITENLFYGMEQVSSAKFYHQITNRLKLFQKNGLY